MPVSYGSPFLLLLQGLLKRFGAVGPAMTLLPTIEASTPFFDLLGHVDYGHIVTVIVYLIQINIATGGWGGFVLFGVRKLYIGMPYHVGPGFIIRGALAPIVCGVLVHIIMVMGLRRGVCWVTGVLLLLYLLQHLRQPYWSRSFMWETRYLLCSLSPA